MMYLKYLVCFFILISACCFVSTSAKPLDGGTNTTCGESGNCLSNGTVCEEICGCDLTIPTVYDNKTQSCEINITMLISSLTEKYNTEAKIRKEADIIFRGVIVAAFFFISCASICVLMACVYCCRMNYTDYRLKKNIKELAKKVGGNPQLRRSTVKSPTKPISESCNVIVEDAGVFCV